MGEDPTLGGRGNSFFAGTDRLISDFLALAPGDSLKQKRVNARLRDPPGDSLDFPRLVSALFERICSNRTDRRPSQENWRVERQTKISGENRSAEVMLERAVAQLGERGLLEEWYNQIPVASGLVNAYADKRAAVDLMRYRGNRMVLAELKWASDQPAFAAFEILLYGLAFLFAYVHQHDLGYQKNPLMGVNQASLWVLAPQAFFKGHNLRWLGAGLCEGVGAVSRMNTDGLLSMDFAFMAFPADFRLPFESGAEVARVITGEAPGSGAVISAVRGAAPIWESPSDRSVALSGSCGWSKPHPP